MRLGGEGEGAGGAGGAAGEEGGDVAGGTIYVKNLAFATTDAALKKHFDKVGWRLVVVELVGVVGTGCRP